MSANYYDGGKRVMRDGAPCKVASWVGELGNDKEFIEATRPRTEYKKAYYEGGYRMIFDGVPCRMSAHVADWAPWMRRALNRGADNRKDAAETERQWFILCPAAKAASEARKLEARLSDYRKLSDADLKARLEYYSDPDDLAEVQLVLAERSQSVEEREAA